MCSPIVISPDCVQWVSERPHTSSCMAAASLTIFSTFPGLFIPLTFQVPARNVVCNINCWLLLVRPVAHFTRGAWTVAPSRRRRVGSHGWFIVEILFMVECVPRSVTDGGSWVHCRPVRLFWRPSPAMTQERYRRMWYFKERRIPPLLPPHPSSLAAAVHDCLFSIFTVNPHFWGLFGYPQPADALGSCSSLLSASPLAASFPVRVYMRM